MRKVMAGALAAAALSWASGAAAAESAKQEAGAKKEQAQQKSGQAQQKASGSQAGGSMQGTGSGAAHETGAQGRADKKHPLFEGKKNFDVDGKVAEVSASAITIQRNELPSAKLHVSKDTKVEVDGKKASVQELKRGQDVKASFNLQGDKAEAVEIKADKLDKNDRKEMTEQKRENQKEQQKQQQKQQKQ